MSKTKKRGPGRPATLSAEERRRRNLARVNRWRKAHPQAWDQIWKRAYAKLKAKKAQRGVHVELDLSALP